MSDQLAVDIPQRVLVRNREDDDVCAGWHTLGHTLARGMRDLRGLVTARQVRSDDDVVIKGRPRAHRGEGGTRGRTVGG